MTSNLLFSYKNVHPVRALSLYICNRRIKLLSDSPQSSVIHVVCHLEETLIPYSEIRYVFERVSAVWKVVGKSVMVFTLLK